MSLTKAGAQLVVNLPPEAQAFVLSVQRDFLRFWPFILAVALVLGIRRLFAVPAELAHLPRVPVLPTLLSYARGEVEDVRIKRLILPFANEKGESVVVIYALGRWIVHVLDAKIARDLSDDIVQFPKEVPPDGMLLWRFVGYSNIILSNGDAWKRHSRIVKAALNRNVPLEGFASLAKKLFRVMGDGGALQWDDLTMRFTLDAVGTTALGHDFNAIQDAASPFVLQYNHVMESIANPVYLVFPRLEKILPRVQTIEAIDKLVQAFQGLLQTKKQDKGNDMLTYMLEEPGMSDTEYRDNMVVFFIAGHDTTAGAMASLTYYLAIHPEVQKKARAEAVRALKDNTTGEPTMAELREMPYIQACIRESLRINTPITYMVPRSSSDPVTLVGGTVKRPASATGSLPASKSYATPSGKSYAIPGGASIILNITSIHYNEHYWPDAGVFRPERFMGMGDAREKEVDASMWLPFALGARQCPARNFAMYELRVLAAMLLREWEWSLPKGSVHAPENGGIKNGFSPFALSLPKDLLMDFKKLDVVA